MRSGRFYKKFTISSHIPPSFLMLLSGSVLTEKRDLIIILLITKVTHPYLRLPAVKSGCFFMSMKGNRRIIFLRRQPPLRGANEIVMTKEGYDDLVKELNELKTTRRAEISEKIRVARGFGDLSENSEYDEAKNEQAIVEARILTLENQLKNVKIIEKSDTVKGTVSLGSFVTIRDVEFGDEMTYRIISSVESSNDMSTITDESPVGKALLGHKAGETVEVTIPSGAQIESQIIKV